MIGPRRHQPAAALVAALLSLAVVGAACGGDSSGSESSVAQTTTSVADSTTTTTSTTIPATTSTTPVTTIAPTTVPVTTIPTTTTPVTAAPLPGVDPAVQQYVREIGPFLDTFDLAIGASKAGNDAYLGGDLAGAADQYTQAETFGRQAVEGLDLIVPPPELTETHAALRNGIDLNAQGYAMSVVAVNTDDQAARDESLRLRDEGNVLLDQAADALTALLG